MVHLMNRSIDLLEELAHESKNIFGLNRRGYIFGTGDTAKLASYVDAGQQAEAFGAGELRIHESGSSRKAYHPAEPEGYQGAPEGADLLLDTGLINERYPYLAQDTVGLLHIRRAGWLSAQQLGMYLLAQAQKAGVQLVRDQVVGVDTEGGRVSTVRLKERGRFETRALVNAAGPMVQAVADLLDTELPIHHELHLKVAFRDHLGIVAREAPMLIWSDSQTLSWDPEEREMLAEDPDSAWLLDEFPSGVHTRPEGGSGSQIVLLLWEYNSHTVQPQFPISLDPLYPEIALRGMVRMIPDLAAYLNRLPKPTLDGGYYTKTQENRPIAGPMPVEGAYVIGALSGFGIMSGPALGELVATHITGNGMPAYAEAFSLDRYKNSDYQKKLNDWGESWQL
jgi:glycine/D-amino acid oxidase-like deaminating enzyme